ncbi:YopN family type III secretion system gatekeeper subunit [Pigmentiphaga aceris]|uniref:YopN family type III secretion system gatekeeper subunit n=2 Tax=Pigmentiphaga aceris TaxID=1940612 RepID=A0A5C0B5R9_9BURK|nr:YopN family type III secretion system gatekeeper subunit [Pigmentiphaga aceris]
MNRIDAGTNIASYAQTSMQAGAGQTMGQQAGLALGEAVVHVEGEFSLADSAEELSLHMAEKTEEKTHAERTVKSDRPLQVLDAAEIEDLLDETHDADAQAKLSELTKHLLEGKGNPREQAGKAFEDISQQYLALQYALQKGEQEGASVDVLEGLRDAIADMEMESGPEIRAGINSLRTAGAFGADAAGVADFQRTYRDVVLGENSLSKTLNLAIERFGEKDVGRGVKQLIQALGADLAATKPSTDSARLQSLIQDLYQLEVAVTVLDGCAELSATHQARGGAPLDSTKLMRDLVSVTGERWVSASRFTGIADSQNVRELDARIPFLTGVKHMMRDLPVQIYPDTDTRQSILGASQEALDLAIDQEEEQ